MCNAPIKYNQTILPSIYDKIINCIDKEEFKYVDISLNLKPSEMDNIRYQQMTLSHEKNFLKMPEEQINEIIASDFNSFFLI